MKWCIEFWDFGAWNEMAVGTISRWKHKAQAVTECQRLNKERNPQHPDSSFEGHRFRVRRVKELGL